MDEKDRPKTEIDFKITHPEIWHKEQKSLRSYVKFRRITDIATVLIFFAMIFSLGFFKIIGGETVAALLGAMVGYCFEYWREKAKQD
ncbi:MAG TPA: hypothetical protein VK559_13590 [Ferruginibacter sp.]|nr:hypothetical protein [Ferruginibacter sp.]